MLTTQSPFILLDDARREHAAAARLYKDPIECIDIEHGDQLPVLFERLRQARIAGYHVAGFLEYETGIQLNGLSSLNAEEKDSGWFGVFESYHEIAPEAVTGILPDPGGAWIGPITPDISREDYARIFAKVQEYIRAGDIYQANLTFRAQANYTGDPLALYAAIRPHAAAGYGGVIWTGEKWLLSFSPELFFALKDGRVTTKPMKGTAAVSRDAQIDAARREDLRTDPKQRAENLMIVDLLRNDLSRICEAGSVDVPQLFHIESYPTVHQMTSTVTGTLSSGKGAVDLLATIFPCGSITGAPKIRAMQIIDEVETTPRGAYCGAIGRIDANGDAAFNVGIRTFDLNEKNGSVSLGLGSGVVADSTMDDEWAECLAKGRFAQMPQNRFDLVETMRFEPDSGIARLELHLERMKASARELGFEFDRHATRNQLHAASFHLEVASRVRLLLGPRGSITIDISSYSTTAAQPWTAEVMPLPVDARDFRLRHKTTDRGFYDDARNASHADEVVFEDSDGFLTEGCISSIFVERGGIYLTPPLSRGLLPSVLRRELIDAGQAKETDLRREDLVGGFMLGNSLRGLIVAKLDIER